MKFLTNKKDSPFNKDIWCVVMHPVEYQIPFYEELFKLSKGNSLIIFMDNHSIKPFRIEKWGIDNLLQVRSSNNPLKYKFNYFFSKNFTIFKHKLFVNRINPGIIDYLKPGCGFGGSCFPKDIQAIINFAQENDIDLEVLKGAWKTNLTVRLSVSVKVIIFPG